MIGLPVDCGVSPTIELFQKIMELAGPDINSRRCFVVEEEDYTFRGGIVCLSDVIALLTEIRFIDGRFESKVEFLDTPRGAGLKMRHNLWAENSSPSAPNYVMRHYVLRPKLALRASPT